MPAVWWEGCLQWVLVIHNLYLRNVRGWARRGSHVPSDNSKAQSEEYNYTCIFVILLPEGIDYALDLALLFSCQRETDYASQVLSLVPSSLFTKTAQGVLFPWKQQKQNRINHHVQTSLSLPSQRGSCEISLLPFPLMEILAVLFSLSVVFFSLHSHSEKQFPKPCHLPQGTHSSIAAMMPGEQWFPRTSYRDIKVYYLLHLISSKPQDMVQLFPIDRYVNVTKDLFTATIISFQDKKKTPGKKNKATTFKVWSLQLEQESDVICCALRLCDHVLFYLRADAIVLWFWQAIALFSHEFYLDLYKGFH